MRAAVVLGAVGVATVGGMLLSSSAPALACTPGPDFDPVAQSEVIVGGRITGWRLVENVRRWDSRSGEPEPTGDPSYWGPAAFDPIRLAMGVDRVYKGGSAGEIELFAANTMSVSKEGGATSYRWVGSSGACGAFNSDPTGGYFIFGLVRDAFGRLHPSLPLMFYFGPQPPPGTGDVIDARLEQLGLSAWSLPSGGGPLRTSDDSGLAALALVVVGLVACLAGAALLRRRGG